MGTESVEFLAVLVFEEGADRRAIVEHVFRAGHPEIAYQCALAKGREERYGWRFAGLAALRVATDEPSLLGVTEGGPASEIVCLKTELSAFVDPRWIDVAPDPEELAAALREPPVLTELDGLEAIEWGSLSHAYGPATDVPRDLRRLASCAAELREQALFELQGSIYHQSDIFDATAAAVPFLVRLAVCTAIPNRREILRFLVEIARSAFWDPEAIRKSWAKARRRYPQLWGEKARDIAEEKIANMRLVQPALIACSDQFRALQTDSDEPIRTAATKILAEIAKEPHAGRGSTDPAI
ncbi:MAG: hypothetical protein ACHRHE_12380 [Tepidisphaerales bacterium]